MGPHPILIQLFILADTGDDDGFKHAARHNPSTAFRLKGLAEYKMSNPQPLEVFTEDGKPFAMSHDTANRILRTLSSTI